MCESSLEFDAYFHHEFNEQISKFESQPEGFYYQLDDKRHSYTPDSLVIYKNGQSKYVEYKPYSKISCPDFRQKFEAKKEAANALNIDLVLVTDKQIRVNPTLDNLKLLHRYTGIYEVNEIQLELICLIKKLGKIKLITLSEILHQNVGVLRALLCLLIGKGLISTNLAIEDLSDNPMVWGATS